MPEFAIQFFAFANVNNTIRLRDGKLLVRLSDLLEGAPESVLRAIAHILLAKMYRKPIERVHATRYRRHVSSREIAAKAHLVRQMRGRKRIESARGRVYDLEAIFETLFNDPVPQFLNESIAKPRFLWNTALCRANA